MKQRILTGWTFSRGLYLAIGIIVVAQSITDHQWIGVVFGAYFASMGLFAFGCAAGNCNFATPKQNEKQIKDINFEEIK